MKCRNAMLVISRFWSSRGIRILESILLPKDDSIFINYAPLSFGGRVLELESSFILLHPFVHPYKFSSISISITISIDTVRDFKMRRASILSLIGSSSAGYFKVDRAGVTWSGANDACRAKGLNLVTFDDEAEYNEVMAFIGDSTDGYWTGFRDDHGTVEPAGYHPFAEGEPNNKIGDEFCIR